jgi:hypothetical protein
MSGLALILLAVLLLADSAVLLGIALAALLP